MTPRGVGSEAGPPTKGREPAGTMDGAVRGERGSPSIDRARSLQARVSSVMACGLMIILGAGLLTWYYSSAFSRQERARQAAKAAASSRAQGEMSLPALGRIESAQTSSATVERSQFDPTMTASNAAPPSQPAQLPLAQSPLSYPYPGMPTAYGPAGVPQKSASQLAKERLLSGAAFSRVSESADSSTTPAGTGAPSSNANSRADGDIGNLLRPGTIASANAHVLPTQQFLLPKGAFIDCTLETAIDSTLPGMTTCITATDTFGVDGKVVLLERGTKLIGETRGQLQQGTARVFVLWTEARTPKGIVVPLDSPGADELGRSGLAGHVDHHFWERFGAAILISTLDGAVQAAVQSSSRGNGTVIYNPSSSESIVTDVLKSTVDIPPTVTKRNGDRIQVFVARDVDFRSVYELRSAATAR
jgi:type IV secretion system protein VirB10